MLPIHLAVAFQLLLIVDTSLLLHPSDCVSLSIYPGAKTNSPIYTGISTATIKLKADDTIESVRDWYSQRLFGRKRDQSFIVEVGGDRQLMVRQSIDIMKSTLNCWLMQRSISKRGTLTVVLIQEKNGPVLISISVIKDK